MYHIIVNPIAGKRLAKKNLEIAERIFRENGAAYRVYETAGAGDAKNIAFRLTSSIRDAAACEAEAAIADGGPAAGENQTAGAKATDVESGQALDAEETNIVVVGGDGTLHEVLNGIADFSGCRLGLIPSGTGNDFAAAIRLPLKAEEAVRKILEDKPKETDFLTVGGVRCMNVGGMGMDVDVLVRCRKGRIQGKIKYLISLLQSLFTFKGCEVVIESGARKETRKALLAVACNGTQIGGGIRICPAAVADDGKLDVMAVDCKGKMQIVKAFLYLMKGKVLEYPAAEHFLCERVRITPSAPCTVQLDGELYDGLDFDAKIERGLKMYR